MDHRDPKLDIEIVSLKITLISDFTKIIKIEK